MKRTFVILLCVLLLAAATLTTVSATAGSVTITASTDKVKPGKTVEFVASLAEFPVAEAIAVTVEVPTGLTVQSGQWLLEGPLADYNAPAKIGVWGSNTSVDLTESTEVFKLTCVADALAEEVEEQDFTVKMTFKVKAEDTSKGTVETTVCVKVSNNVNPVGDIDGDMEVTRSDVIRLLLYVTLPNRYPIDAPADFNGDDEVTRADVIKLLLHVTLPNRYPL